jgi:hypothetical protein
VNSKFTDAVILGMGIAVGYAIVNVVLGLASGRRATP